MLNRKRAVPSHLNHIARSPVAQPGLLGCEQHEFSMRFTVANFSPARCNSRQPNWANLEVCAPSISIILPTCGRSSFQRALASAMPQLAERDEVLVVGDGSQPDVQRTIAEIADARLKYREHGPTNFYGNAQRNLGMAEAGGDWIVFLDDDDELCESALTTVRQAAAQHPNRPMMFRLKCERPRFVIWRTQEIRPGNISGGAFVIPNIPERTAQWPTPQMRRHGCSDVTFIEETLALYPPAALVWRPEIIYRVPRRSFNAR